MRNAKLSTTLLACLFVPAVWATPTYSLSGLVLAGNGNVSSVLNTGLVSSPVTLTDSITNPGWGSAAYSATASGNLLSVSGNASATAVVGDGLGTSGLGAFNFTGELFDSLTFSSSSGDPLTVRFTLFLNDSLSSSSPGDAKAQVNASFSPAGNTFFFNTGLNDYDTIGTGFGPSVTDASGLYLIPNGATINFGVQLVVQSSAHFGVDFSIPANPTFATAVDVNAAAGFVGLEILTPGGSYTSGSGASYDLTSASAVPEAASVGALLGLGLGAMGFAHRQRRRSTV